MCSLVIYLNEMSCGLHGLGLNEIQSHVATAIGALQATSRLRSDASLRLPMPLAQVTFGDALLTFPALFPDANDKFTVLKRYVDRSPYGPVSQIEKEVVYAGRVGIGMSWAHFESSFVLSVGHAPPWSEVTISAEEHGLDQAGAFTSTVVQISNLATPSHAAYWRQRIEDYGRDVVPSSLLYRGGQFVIRMHLSDHDPPHVHVYPYSDDTRNHLARIRIDNRDVLDGHLPSAFRDEVMALLARNSRVLMDGWTRCKTGRHPLQIQ